MTELQEDKRSLEDELTNIKESRDKTRNWEDPSYVLPYNQPLEILIYNTFFRSPANMKIKALQNQTEKLEEDAFKLEMQRDEYKLKSESLEKQLSEKVEKVNAYSEEILRTKDELDILRNNQHKLVCNSK